jgi:hypothetical protein
VPPDRNLVDAWWRSPVASILLVIAGLVILAVEVSRGRNADAGGYTAGLALVGLGITGRLQAWILPDEGRSKRKDDEA